MSMLPDELWSRIIEIGIDSKTLDSKTLCCLSITCRRFRRLADDDALWSPLYLSDYPSFGDDLNSPDTSSSTANGKFKTLYKISYEKNRERERLAHRRLVLRIESQISEHLRKIEEMQLKASEEKEKRNKAILELLNLRRSRRASVALNVWQPEIIRDSQRQMVQQSNVSVDFRINSLEMEVNLCNQQIARFDRSLKLQSLLLCGAKDELASVKYHPFQESNSTSFQLNESRVRNKRLKHASTVKF